MLFLGPIQAYHLSTLAYAHYPNRLARLLTTTTDQSNHRNKYELQRFEITFSIKRDFDGHLSTQLAIK
jgi:hypothetical protein